MIVEQRTYTLYPNKTAEYIAHFEREGIAIQRPILGRLIGYFSSEIGSLNQMIHLWGYESFEERTRRRAILAADPRWREYVTKNIQPLIVRMENKILIPTPYSPPLPPLWQESDSKP